MNYHLTQFFSGHGCFASYLARIGKLEDGQCRQCGEEEDTPVHTVLFIMDKLRSRHISRYLCNTVGNYLNNRKIVVGKNTAAMTAGVPQGSVLGPTLWNVLYDDLLKIPQPPGVELTCYADDLAVTIAAGKVEELNHKINVALLNITRWMEDHSLEVAPQKTEAVVLKGPYKRDQIQIFVMGNRIPLSRSVRYLGITIDTQGYFGHHIRDTVQKAKRRISALTRLLPNVAGPGSRKRQVLWGVVQSTILYAAPVWHKALKIARYKNMLESTQRQMLLRVASAYCTVSAAAVQVITGVPPIDLMVLERVRLADTEGESRNPKLARAETMARWQERWDQTDTVAQWTKKLIPDVGLWTGCKHRRTDYWLTQFLSGHGSFRTYTHRIGKDPVPICRYCGAEDSPEHTIFDCVRWEANRCQNWNPRRNRISTETIITEMIDNPKKWDMIARGIRDIMTTKEKEEREFQAGNPPAWPPPLNTPTPFT